MYTIFVLQGHGLSVTGYVGMGGKGLVDTMTPAHPFFMNASTRTTAIVPAGWGGGMGVGGGGGGGGVGRSPNSTAACFENGSLS